MNVRADLTGQKDNDKRPLYFGGLLFFEKRESVYIDSARKNRISLWYGKEFIVNVLRDKNVISAEACGNAGDNLPFRAQSFTIVKSNDDGNSMLKNTQRSTKAIMSVDQINMSLFDNLFKFGEG